MYATLTVFLLFTPFNPVENNFYRGVSQAINFIIFRH
jgi:hypothetical protein